MARLQPDQVTQDASWGPVRAMLFRPWLLLGGVCWGLAVGTKWDALFPLAARLLHLGRVDVGVLVVVEESEEAVEAHIERRWLKQVHVERFETDSTGFNFGADIAIRHKHGSRLPPRLMP